MQRATNHRQRPSNQVTPRLSNISNAPTHTSGQARLSTTVSHSRSVAPRSLAQQFTKPTTVQTRSHHSSPRGLVSRHCSGAVVTGVRQSNGYLASLSRTSRINTTSQRTLFIQTATTPNPRSLKFMPGKEILPPLEDGSPNTAFFDSADRAKARLRSNIAYTILCIDGVMNVMFGDDFLTVTLNEGEDWLGVKPLVFAAISDAFASDEPIIKPESEMEASKEQATLPGDEEAVALIKEIIDLRIRPTVMDDGGDLEFIKFDENRVVWLLLKGSCSGCPSSGATLKQGIQNMIMHYVPEVLAVEEYKDQLATVSDEALQKLEERLEAKRNKNDTDSETTKH